MPASCKRRVLRPLADDLALHRVEKPAMRGDLFGDERYQDRQWPGKAHPVLRMAPLRGGD
jgi:hypothetical protein